MGFVLLTVKWAHLAPGDSLRSLLLKAALMPTVGLLQASARRWPSLKLYWLWLLLKIRGTFICTVQPQSYVQTPHPYFRTAGWGRARKNGVKRDFACFQEVLTYRQVPTFIPEVKKPFLFTLTKSLAHVPGYATPTAWSLRCPFSPLHPTVHIQMVNWKLMLMPGISHLCVTEVKNDVFFII